MVRNDRILTLTGQVDGKEAIVDIYPDRVEWRRQRARGVGLTRPLGGAIGRLSFSKTNISAARRDADVIPIDTISSVATEREGLRDVKVVVTHAERDTTFRVAHTVSDTIQILLKELVLGAPTTLRSGAVPPDPLTADELRPPHENDAAPASPPPAPDRKTR